jgi:DTW domain-containing protein YfiP
MGGFDPFLAAMGDAAAQPAPETDCARCRWVERGGEMREEGGERKRKAQPSSPLVRRPTRATAFACICAALPPARVPTKGRLFVLQHPHEVCRRLGTVPLITAALDDAEVNDTPILLLFPGPDSVDCADAAAGALAAVAAGLPPSGILNHPSPYLLIIVDGTWRHGRQLFTAAAPWLLPPAGRAVRVSLPIGDDAADVATLEESRNVCADTKTVALFKEPHAGCMTTAEAVARALTHFEPSRAPADAVLAALHAVVDRQKAHDPAVAARCGVEGAAGLTSARSRFGFRNPPRSVAPAQATPWKGGEEEAR